MTGGWDRRTQTTAEVFFPSTNTGCSVNNYALPRIVHTHTMNTFQKQTLICGGSPTRFCYEFSPASLDSLSTVWPKYANLTEGRYEHTSWVSSAGVVLIGGYAPFSANAETTAEIVKVATCLSLCHQPGSFKILSYVNNVLLNAEMRVPLGMHHQTHLFSLEDSLTNSK